MSRRRPSKSDNREAMLRGATLLLADSVRDYLSGVLTSGAVASAAGLHRQSFYNHWSNHEEFLEDFVQFVTDPAQSTAADRLSHIEEDLDDAGEDPATEVRRMAQRTYVSWHDDPVQYARMVLWAAHPDDDAIRDGLRRAYRANDAAAAEGFGAVGDRWGIEPRPPFTLQTVALLFNALRDGLMLQLQVRGDDLPASFFGDLHLALSRAVTRRKGEEVASLDELYRAHVARAAGEADQAGAGTGVS